MNKKNTTSFGAILLALLLTLIMIPTAAFAQETEPTATADAATEPIAEPAEDSATASFSYSDGLDENGHWIGVVTADCLEMPAYKGISIPADTHTISDEAIQSEKDTLLESYIVNEQLMDRAVNDGDTVNIDFVGSVDGVEFDGGSTGGAGTDVTIGVTSYIDDFLEQLIGHMPGETINVEVTFPEDYGTDTLNGKDAVFVTTINHIVETITPELTDAFVAENLSASNGWNTVAEMDSGIREELQSSAIKQYVQNYLLENTTILSLPESMVEYQENTMLQYYSEYASYFGMELGDFLSGYMGISSVDDMLETYAETNRQGATYQLIIQAIAEDAAISVSDEDITNFFVKYYGDADYTDFEGTYGKPYLTQMVLSQATLDHIVSSVVME